MDFKGFKKVDADKHYTTFQHPDGHLIKVCHKGLDRPTRQEVRHLKMAKGGMVPGYAEGGEVKQPGFMDILSELGNQLGVGEAEVAPSRPHTMVHGEPVFQDQVREPSLPIEGQGSQLASLSPMLESQPQVGGSGNYQFPAPGQGQPAAPQDPYGTQAYESALLGGIGQQKQGLKAEAAAQNQLGQDQAAQQQGAADSLKKLQGDYDTHYNQLQSEREALLQDIQDGHIDPHHLWDSKSTAGHVSTAIGILLSGLGSGLSGQENMAMKFLNQQIDRDVEAQKTNLNKKQSLLSANQQQFGNIRDAQQATKAMLLDVTAAQIAKAAATAQGPLAAAKAQQAIGALEQQSAGIKSQLAARKALMSGGQGAAAANPAVAIRMLVPEGQQQAAYKELGDAQESTKAVQHTLKTFNDIKQLQSASSRLGSPLQSKRQIDALKGPITAALSKATAGRFTETDARFLDSLWPALGDNDVTANKKMGAIQKLLEEKFNFPILSAYGLAPKFPKVATPIANAPAKFGK